MGARSEWAMAGVEPPLEEIMSDPIMALVLRRDGLTQATAWKFLTFARARLARTPEHTGVSPAVPHSPGAEVTVPALRPL